MQFQKFFLGLRVTSRIIQITDDRELRVNHHSTSCLRGKYRPDSRIANTYIIYEEMLDEHFMRKIKGREQGGGKVWKYGYYDIFWP